MVFRFFPLFQTLRRAALLGVALCGVVAGRAWGAEEAPTLVTADRMAYDQNAGIVTASGHVEVVQADQVLHAEPRSSYRSFKVMLVSDAVMAL